jgi:hypothetical protein
MLGNHFYNQTVRKSVAMFGSLFNDLYIVRKGSGTDSVAQIRVPLAYAPKRKYLERLDAMINGEEDERQLAIKLPRMSFEITSIAYDPTRQLSKMQRLETGGDGITRSTRYVGSPYTITFQLDIYAKGHDDALQVVEQVIPFFNPSLNIATIPFEENDDCKIDVPLTLSGVTFADDFEGSVEDRRTIIYTLEFQFKTFFFGPVYTRTDIIREVNMDLYNMDAGYADSDLFLERVQVLPNPINVTPDSDYTYTTNILDSA